ncbi:MAG: flavodoxin [Ruminococcaceae bacterium]|nr:flavodoxin [Oscillospiraceae bacterium]
MRRTLITCFSAGGTTARVAKELSSAIGAELFPIRPEKPYSEADLNWRNPIARCNREKIGRKDVPVKGSVEDFEKYDTVVIGFPIWYGAAPNVVNTFCKGYDWTGKRVFAFATSGGSGIGKTADKLKPYVKGAESVDARLVTNAMEIISWLAES